MEDIGVFIYINIFLNLFLTVHYETIKDYNLQI